MTDKAKRQECVKRDIRSVLLTQPNGFTITSFLSDYRNMIGKDLPYREFGYSVPDDFLRSIPDVVSMNWSPRYNSYILKAVADETTKHIEKLVSKQKTSKSAVAASRRTASAVPPRLCFRGRNNKASVKAYFPVSIQKEIYSVAKEFKSGLSLPNFLTAFRRKHGKDLIYKNYGFYTLEDSLNTIREVFLRCECNEMRIYPIIEKQAEERPTCVYSESWNPVQNTKSNCNRDNKENQSVNTTSVTDEVSFVAKPTEGKTMDVLDNFSYQGERSDNFGIGSALKEQFKQIMKNNPQGIWVSQFPQVLQKFSGNTLNHRKLGYFNLIDLFNDLPEIFRVDVFDGCKDDWMLFDATSPVENFKHKKGFVVRSPSGKKVSHDRFEIIKNIRLLLQANCEGVNFDDFCNLYEANCDEQFSLYELGFDSLSVFLETVAEKVPLKIDYSGKSPRVYYKKEETAPAISKSVSSHSELPLDVPSDAVVGCTEYKVQNISEDFNTDQFFPVCLTAVVDPSHLYIQLHRKDASLENLMDELEFFYYGRNSERYRMPAHYIMSGVVCAAVWPSDGRWHRIRISSVPSNNTVVAFFVDYGTKERIPSDNLRFLRKKFMELPAQAIKSHLCRLKPFHGDTWDPRAKDLILNSFGREPIMACLTVKPVGEESLSLVLCDVSGDNDVFLDHLLVSEGFAKYETDQQNVSDHEEPSGHDSYFRAEELVLPISNQKPEVSQTKQQVSVSPGSKPGNLLQIMSLIAPSMGSYDVQNPNNSVINLLNNFSNGDPALLHPLVSKQLEALGINNNTLNKPATSSPIQPAAKNPEPSFNPSSVGFYGQSAPVNLQRISHESDSEVFESDEEIDDDDNPEVNSISKRYVKRINLDDGYHHVHMIVIDDRPYMSSGDITFLLWSHDDPNFVRRKLKSKEISIPNNTVNEFGYEQLFYQLGRFQVKGIKTEVTGNSYVTLFPFKNVIDILNIFGHPSVAVRDIIDDELLHFDPSDSFWKTISEEEFEESSVKIETASDKEQKLCLHELKATLKALEFRKQTLKNQLCSSANLPSLGDEIERIETQCAEVGRRIKELQVKVVSHQRERGFD